jgi:hypothetical protein
VRTLVISLVLLGTVPAALEAQSGTFYYLMPTVRPFFLQDTSGSWKRNLTRLLTRADTTKVPGVVAFRDSSQMPVCPMPVHVPDTSMFARMPIAGAMSSQVYAMPVAKSACRNPLFKQFPTLSSSPKR